MAEILRHRWKWCTRHRLCSLRLAEKACEKGDDEAYSVGFITKKSAGQVVRSGNTSDLIGSSCATKGQDCVTPPSEVLLRTVQIYKGRVMWPPGYISILEG